MYDLLSSELIPSKRKAIDRFPLNKLQEVRFQGGH